MAMGRSGSATAPPAPRARPSAPAVRTRNGAKFSQDCRRRRRRRRLSSLLVSSAEYTAVRTRNDAEFSDDCRPDSGRNFDGSIRRRPCGRGRRSAPARSTGVRFGGLPEAGHRRDGPRAGPGPLPALRCRASIPINNKSRPSEPGPEQAGPKQARLAASPCRPGSESGPRPRAPTRAQRPSRFILPTGGAATAHIVGAGRQPGRRRRRGRRLCFPGRPRHKYARAVTGG